MPAITYQVDGFPEDDDFWRIEWFGGISYNPRVSSEHLIEVNLARVSPGTSNKIHPKYLSLRTDRKNVQVGIGYLPYLAIGTVWQKLLPAMCELSIPEKPFQIDVDTQQFILTDSWTNGRRVVAKSKYPFGDNWHVVKDTMLAAIEHGGDPYGILIPALELFRFYYATSTYLAKAACWGEWKDAYDSEKSGRMSDGNFKVHLQQYVNKHDAWTLARFIHSPVMQQQLERFHRQIQTAQINAGSIPVTPIKNLECGFPFSGKTTIRGRAINVSNGTTPRWLVVRLTGCAYPLMFGNVIATKDGNFTEVQGGVNEGMPCVVKHIHPPSGQKEQVDVFKSDAEPSLKLKPLEIQIPEDRFDGLKGKKLITPTDKERGETSIRMVSTAADIIDGLGSGDGTHGKSSRRRVRLHNVPKDETPPKLKETLPHNLDNFMEALRQLRKKHGFQGAFIGTGDKDILDGDSIFATFPKQNPISKRPLKWSVLSNGASRRVVIARIIVNEKTVYAMEIERNTDTEHYSTPVIALQSFEAFSKTDWGKFMLQCAIKNRWSKKSEDKILRRATTTHKDLVDVDVFADRIWRCVTEVLEGEGEDAGK